MMDESEFEVKINSRSGEPIYTMDQPVADRFEKVEHRYPTAENIAIRAESLFDSEAKENRMRPLEPHYLRPPFITKAKKKPVPGFPQ